MSDAGACEYQTVVCVLQYYSKVKKENKRLAAFSTGWLRIIHPQQIMELRSVV